MVNQRFIWSSIILIMILMNLAPLAATDLNNTSWPKYQHDLNNTGQSSYIGPQTNETKWNFSVSISESGVTLGKDGTIYAGGRNQTEDCNLFAINPNGTLKWSFGIPVDVCTTPAIDSEGNIYFAAMEIEPNFYFYALYPNGTQKWNYTMSEQLYSSPTVGPDGTIYVGCFDGYLYAFNPNGTIKWKAGKYDAIGTTPAINKDGIIYVGTTAEEGQQGFMFAINSTGSELWNFETSGIMSSPSIGTDGTIYFASNNGNLYALYPNGTEKWSFQMDYDHYSDIMSPPAIALDGTIYIGSNNGLLYSLKDAVDHAVQNWLFDTKFNEGTSKIVPSIGADGTIYFGGHRDNVFYALNPNGTQKWNYTVNKEMNNRISASAIALDGTLYFIDYYFGGEESEGTLHAIKGALSSIYVQTMVNNQNPKIGDIIKLTFKLGNKGPDSAYNTIFKYTIPEGMKYINAFVDFGTVSYDAATRTITWNLGNVPKGDPYLYLYLQVLKAGTYKIQPLVSTWTYDPNISNNIKAVIINAQSQSYESQVFKAKTVGMQKTGLALEMLTFAVLMVLVGLSTNKRKK